MPHFWYPFRYLFEAVTDQGEIISQHPQDRSRRFPGIELIPIDGSEVAHQLDPDNHPEILSAISSGYGTVQYLGIFWHWRMRTSTSDIQELIDQGRIAFFLLRPVVEPGPTAMVRLLPIEWQGVPPLETFGVGDIWVLPGGGMTPVITPFQLPMALWPVDENGQRVMPSLQLLYGREVTVKGPSLDQMTLHDVSYRIGWKTRLNDQEYQQVVAVC